MFSQLLVSKEGVLKIFKTYLVQINGGIRVGNPTAQHIVGIIYDAISLQSSGVIQYLRSVIQDNSLVVQYCSCVRAVVLDLFDTLL